MGKIRYIATSVLQPSLLFLAAEDENIIEVWNVQSRERISTIHSILDGFRLALASDQLHCLAGNYRQGVALYNIDNSQEVWRRSDLRRLQFVQFSKDGGYVFCGFDNGPGQVLRLDSGRTIRLWRGVQKLFESPCDNRIFLHKNSKSGAITGLSQKVSDVPIEYLKSGPLLDVAFSPWSLCFSEYTAVRCFDLEGLEMWRTSLGPNERVIRLSYQHRLESYFGILSDLTSTKTSIVKINRENGTTLVVSSLGLLQQVGFCGDAKAVCTDGTMWDLEIGNRVANLWEEKPEPER